MRRLAVLLALLLAAPAPAAELEPLLTDEAIAPWKGVGRLVMARRSTCTGALVAPRIVLTAAHCLYDHDAHELVTPEEVEFMAGLRDGRYAAVGQGRRIVVHPDYRYNPRVDGLDRNGVDIAIVELQAPLQGNGVRPFELSTAFFKGDPVTVVSYAKGRNEYPSMERGCRTELRTRTLAEFACSVDFGASGAPVFRDGPGGPRIVSVISAILERGDDRLALGAVLGHMLPILMQELNRTSPGRKRVTPGGGVLPGASRPPDR